MLDFSEIEIHVFVGQNAPTPTRGSIMEPTDPNNDRNGEQDFKLELLFSSSFERNETLVCDNCHRVYVFEKLPVCPHCLGKPKGFSTDRVRLEKIKIEIGWKESSDEARAWWLSIESAQGGELKSLVYLASQLLQRGSSIEEIYRAYSRFKIAPVAAFLFFMEFLRGRLADLTGAVCEEDKLPYMRLEIDSSIEISKLPAGITNTRGWSDDEVRTKLDQVLKTLGWENTTDNDAKQWWCEFEENNMLRLALVLRVAEELSLKNATVQEFYLAYTASGETQNIQGVLYYLEFLRLKNDEEKKKRKIEEDELAKVKEASTKHDKHVDIHSNNGPEKSSETKADAMKVRCPSCRSLDSSHINLCRICGHSMSS